MNHLWGFVCFGCFLVVFLPDANVKSRCSDFILSEMSLETGREVGIGMNLFLTYGFQSMVLLMTFKGLN